MVKEKENNHIKGIIFTNSDWFIQKKKRDNKVKRLRNNGYLVNTYETLDIWNIKHYWYETNL